MQPTFGTILIRPHAMQFIVNDLPLVAICAIGFICGGIDDFPYSSIILAMSLCISIVLCYHFFYMKRMKYKIGSEQLIYEHGVFTRSSDYIELYRVIDFRESRSFMQQLFGLKTVSIYSGDRTTPRLDIIGVKDDVDLVAYVRERVETIKRNRHVYEITNR